MNGKEIFEKHKTLFKGYLQKKKYREGFDIEKASLSEIDEIKKAIEIAYSTANRTFSFIETTEERGEKYFGRLLNDNSKLADDFYNYFRDNDPVNFEGIHKNLCKDIQELFKGKCKDGCPTYGQCQKIVNVTFKILYFFKGAKEEYFKPCHMILDSYTLNWYRENTEDKKVYTWSKLSDKEYAAIQKEIRDSLLEKRTYYGVPLPETVFKAEFIIWRQEMLRAALKDTLKSFSDMDESDSVDLEFLNGEFLSGIRIDKKSIDKDAVQSAIAYLEKVYEKLGGNE